jgi:hypothetical protein
MDPLVSSLLSQMASHLSDDTLLSDPTFAGLFSALNPENDTEQPSATQIVDDYEAEQDTFDLHGGANVNSSAPSSNDKDMGKASSGPEFSELQETVKNASKGVTEGTDGEYRRFAYFTMYFFYLQHFQPITCQPNG